MPSVKELISQITLWDEPHLQIPVKMPFTGELLGQIPGALESDVDLAVSRARAAQAEWSRVPFHERARVFLRFHDLLLQRQDEVLDLIQLESGKARRHAFEEILDTAVVSRYYAFHAKRILRPRRRRGALPFLTKTVECRAPLGVVGFFTPWNFPLVLSITDAIAAVMAGNAGVIKPDPQASFTALWAVALLREAGLPRDVLAVVTGEGPVVGPLLAGRVDYVMFTGSCRVGRIVGRQAAERLIGCSLELGGKNSMLVFADADLEAAVDGAVRGCFAGAGQVCISIERILVERSIFDRFVARFAERTRSVKLGASPAYSVEMGSLTTEQQLRTVEAHVTDAVAKGATVAAGGRRRADLGPLFYEPTILTGARPGMLLYEEETFGPVVAVYPFSTEDEAVAMANATRYGLSASVWTRHARRGMRVARRIRAGSVNVNEAYAAAWGSVDSPIGGMKESGLRPRHGAEGILKYTDSQTIAAERVHPIAPSKWVSADLYAKWMTRLVKLVKVTRVMG
ncbi:MAG TPA: succinic semialdehyde dehydrogenase [Candidatus Sulfopaludibacter sp.]|nr:succinic semialdehyde dehydrogenase [Candidatus Sulfopaludibacter sp.]